MYIGICSSFGSVCLFLPFFLVSIFFDGAIRQFVKELNYLWHIPTSREDGADFETEIRNK